MLRIFLFIGWIGCLLPLVGKAQEERIRQYYQQAEIAAQQAGIPLTLTFIQPEMGLVAASQPLLQIILVRHGNPALIKKGWVNRKKTQDFVRAYDSVGVYPLAFSPVAIGDTEIDTVLMSSLYRAQHTAHLIFGETMTYQADTLFREFERKIMGFPNIKLPLKFWLVHSRILWLMGLNDGDIESFREAKKRAQRAAKRLENSAYRHGKVVLVAHGFLNRFLLKYLQKQGWTLVHNGGSDYLAASLLVKTP